MEEEPRLTISVSNKAPTGHKFRYYTRGSTWGRRGVPLVTQPTIPSRGFNFPFFTLTGHNALKRSCANFPRFPRARGRPKMSKRGDFLESETLFLLPITYNANLEKAFNYWVETYLSERYPTQDPVLGCGSDLCNVFRLNLVNKHPNRVWKTHTLSFTF